ncbi:MAG: type II toxin-antitoxin system PemK/MazF family toxin [Candidatus Promineofilum sp.]|nr:type II toxin-antitoxin system PemK/MazF family toxin [Promineifilum sp.]
MPPTTTYKQGDVVLVPYPFTDSAGHKQRPALVVSANWYNRGKRKYLLSPITSSIPLQLDKDEFPVRGRDYQDAGLTQESIIRCGLLFAIDHQRIIKRLGSLPRGTFDHLLPLFSSLFTDT